MGWKTFSCKNFFGCRNAFSILIVELFWILIVEIFRTLIVEPFSKLNVETFWIFSVKPFLILKVEPIGTFSHSARWRPEDILRASPKHVLWTSLYGPLCNTNRYPLSTSWGHPLPTFSGRWNLRTSWGRPHIVLYVTPRGVPCRRLEERLLQTLWGHPHIV